MWMFSDCSKPDYGADFFQVGGGRKDLVRMLVLTCKIRYNGRMGSTLKKSPERPRRDASFLEAQYAINHAEI